jgi:hypothetical protein
LRRAIRVSSSFARQIFGIGLHIDDSEGVRREGEQYGFDVVVISREDLVWTRSVLAWIIHVYLKQPTLCFPLEMENGVHE